jgi:hypothetical protein
VTVAAVMQVDCDVSTADSDVIYIESFNIALCRPLRHQTGQRCNPLPFCWLTNGMIKYKGPSEIVFPTYIVELISETYLLQKHQAAQKNTAPLPISILILGTLCFFNNVELR